MDYNIKIMGNEKKDFLFRFLPSPVRKSLKTDEEGLYSTTDQLTAEKICKDISKFIPATATVTDATACIGGSCYSLAKTFAKVYAIELDKTRYDFLRSNVMILGVANSVTCIHGDAFDICPQLHQDLIFLDPPWGGPEYKSVSKISLSLSNKPLSEVVIHLSRYTNYVAIKVPTNFDEQTFIDDVMPHMELVHRNINLRKMHLLIFKTKSL